MSEADALQFDRAEFDNGAAQTQCGECRRTLTGFYYDVNGQTVCEACRYTLETRATSGSGAGGFVRALGAGLGAAVVGAALYYMILRVSGYEFGLIAIVVGFGVGTAVRWGSNGRGGWFYQGLAMMLTYLAIVATYVPIIYEELGKPPAEEATVADTAVPGTSDASTPAVPAPAALDSTGPSDSSRPVPPVVMLLIVIVIACAAPFLAGFQNIIGLVIIGIGLYEAWKLNKRSVLTITGPHTLARPAAETAAV